MQMFIGGCPDRGAIFRSTKLEQQAAAEPPALRPWAKITSPLARERPGESDLGEAADTSEAKEFQMRRVLKQGSSLSNSPDDGTLLANEGERGNEFPCRFRKLPVFSGGHRDPAHGLHKGDRRRARCLGNMDG